MTDKEFDNLIRDALNNEDVPSDVNKKLIDKLQKKKKAKIISFVRSASAVAAVFICAVAVLSYYTSDVTEDKFDNAKEKEVQTRTITSAEEKEESIEEEKIIENKEDVKTAATKELKEIKAPAPLAEDKISESEVTEKTELSEEIVHKSTAEELILPDTASEAAIQDAALPETIEEVLPEEEPSPAVFSGRMAENDLSSLFAEGYDYKAVIDEKISAQIALMDFPEPIVFVGITGNERFTLNEENALTIIFSEGEIVSAEHGEQFFTVGIVEDGIIK